MIERVLTGWNLVRALYTAMGSMVIVQSIVEKQWIGIAFGGYFAAMGLFAFGCAAGNCFGGNCNNEPEQKPNMKIRDAELDELKK